jgi:hypothetical protein
VGCRREVKMTGNWAVFYIGWEAEVSQVGGERGAF